MAVLEHVYNDVAVVLVYDPESESILLIKSSDTDQYEDQWIFPGGHVEDHEDVYTAGIREVFEETGIIVEAASKVIFEVMINNKIVSFFIANYISGDIDVDPNEVNEAKWFTLDKIPLDDMLPLNVRILMLVMDQIKNLNGSVQLSSFDTLEHRHPQSVNDIPEHATILYNGNSGIVVNIIDNILECRMFDGTIEYFYPSEIIVEEFLSYSTEILYEFWVKVKGIKDDKFYITINDHEYGYEPIGMSVEDLQKKFVSLAKYNYGQALAWLKRNTKLYSGSKK